MTHLNVEPSPGEQAKSDRTAEKLAEVVYLVIPRVIERTVRHLNSMESTSIDTPIFKSPRIGKLKKD